MYIYFLFWNLTHYISHSSCFLFLSLSLFLNTKCRAYYKDFTGEQTDYQYFGLSILAEQENKSLGEVNGILFLTIFSFVNN